MLKVLLAVINTILSGGAVIILLFNISYTDSPEPRGFSTEPGVYVVCAILFLSIVASWMVALKSPQSVSKVWKLLAFASVFVFLFFAYIFFL